MLIRELALAAYQFHRYFKIHFMFQFKVFLFLTKGFFSFGWVFIAI
ncbi:putative membrane protein [Vibrio cholerae HC-59A1]|nr:putative membrane protein [Vibrio cholerae HC-60A1]EKL18302.1 putative membrane protein [Vibrio cholerae HC-59A1]EKM06750.1 putative membrane protein [Vibrio cholerae HC-55B2]